MPSPRPTGSGALKILLLPQLLKYHILHLVTFSGDPIEPILGFLLGIASVCYCSCHLYGFLLLVVIVRLCKACLAASGLIPAVLRAVTSDVSLLSADIAGDVRKVRSPTSSYKSSSWRGYSASSSSSSSALLRFSLARPRNPHRATTRQRHMTSKDAHVISHVTVTGWKIR